ncbi:putative glycolipid-binding domain-containing protein [Paraflavitalea pollutisoli]|uniref:putative glycolipid-binding domain-containing protein n=1 Tax=Paraflavitalea pollutisoli TaxID=3034143 RepID=UPI0023EAC510|nr:putative glycolipid-binding domain-containing protein [Paraflavitalea sp. H1-2-19X]
MQHNIIWKGIEYHSLENCIVEVTGQCVKVQSSIVGHYQQALYKVDYYLLANEQWETRELEIKCQLRDEIHQWSLRCDARSHWWLQGEAAPQFDQCTDVDITLTCLTNSLPIRRLSFDATATHQIDVVYFNILEQTVLPVQQQYTRLQEGQFKFENVPNDFEAVIDVDEHGLVTYYPDLFERAAVAVSAYKV